MHRFPPRINTDESVVCPPHVLAEQHACVSFGPGQLQLGGSSTSSINHALISLAGRSPTALVVQPSPRDATIVLCFSLESTLCLMSVKGAIKINFTYLPYFYIIFIFGDLTSPAATLAQLPWRSVTRGFETEIGSQSGERERIKNSVCKLTGKIPDWYLDDLSRYRSRFIARCERC